MSLDDKNWLEQMQRASQEFMNALLHPKVSIATKRAAVRDIQMLCDAARLDVTGTRDRGRT